MLKIAFKFFFPFLVKVIIIITFLSCRETDKKVEKAFVINDISKIDTIYLYKDSSINKRITFFIQGELNKYAYPISIKENNNQNAKKIISDDTLVLLEGIKYTPFIIHPGERIIVKANGNENIILETEDGNEIRNNELAFYVELDRKIKWPSAPKIKINTIQDFQNIQTVYKTAYNNSVNFLNNYSQKKAISIQFQGFTKRYLFYKYLMFLFNPSIYGTPVKLRQQIENYKKEFQKDKDLIVPTCKMASYNYSLLLLNMELDKKSVEDHFEVIKENFLGDIQKYLYYRALVNSVDKEGSKPEFTRTAAFFIEKYPSDTLSKIFIKNYDYLTNNRNYLNNRDYLEEKLIDTNGKPILWKEMIKLYSGKVIYIDFWATWCAPCINEFPFSKKLKNQFNSRDIAFIYISSDVEKSRWIDALSEFDIKSDNGNYLLAVPDNSLIKTQFFIYSIPRYMIFDKNGKLVDKDAPRPDDNKIKSILSNLIESRS